MMWIHYPSKWLIILDECLQSSQLLLNLSRASSRFAKVEGKTSYWTDRDGLNYSWIIEEVSVYMNFFPFFDWFNISSFTV